MKKTDLAGSVDELLVEVQQQNDRLEIDAARLLARFDVDRLDRQAADEISRALNRRGISMAPGLKKLLDLHGKPESGDDNEIEPEYVCQATDVAGSEIVLTRSSALAIQGALGITVLATLIGFFGFWLYGMTALIAGLIGAVIVVFGFSTLDAKLPDSAPRGRLLGVLISGALILVLGLAVYIPAREARINDSKEVRAQKFLDQANAKINENDVKSAEDFVQLAMIADPTYSAIVPTSIRLQSLQNELALEEIDSKSFQYHRAQSLIAKKKLAAAAPVLYSLQGFRDVDAVIKENARQIVTALQAEAKGQLAKSPSKAVEAAHLAVLIAPNESLAKSSSALEERAKKAASAP